MLRKKNLKNGKRRGEVARLIFMKNLNFRKVIVIFFNRLFSFRFSFSTFHFPFYIFLLFTACQPNASILNSKSDAPPLSSANSTPAKSSVETDVETMRTADFDFIYVIKRKDSAVLTAEDKTFIKENSPRETNRFLLSDEEKAVVAGSKYKFLPEHLKALSSRFVVENFSKPESETDNNANTNTNANVKAK